MLSLRFIRNVKFIQTLRAASTFECGPTDDSDIVHRDGPLNIPLPEYPDKINEPLENRRARLLYQSRKRGMLENDLLLSTFAAKYLKTMTEQQIIEYDRLINKVSNDWDIYYWAVGSKPTPEEYQNSVWTLFKNHVANEKREKRYTMPALPDN